jgi:tetratricopeptide (TPR) repeat protein
LKYPLKSAQLAKVAALIVASPLQLARRSAALEGALEGEEFVRLAADPAGLSERLKEHPQIDSVALWAQPYQAIADEFSLPNVKGKRFRRQAVAEFAPFAERPILWKARVLHFQGDKGKRAAERNDPLAAERQGHGDAPALYQNPNVRPSDEKLEAEDPTKRVVYAAAKAASSYWLGLLIYDVGDYEVAARWLGDRTLDRDPKGKWADGARYNLARTYEALGQYDDAIKTLESDPETAPQRYGNLVRAKQLAARQAAEADADDEDEEAGESP